MVSANTVELLPTNQEFSVRQSPLGPGVILGSLGTTLASLPMSRLAVRARVSGPIAAVEVLKATPVPIRTLWSWSTSFRSLPTLRYRVSEPRSGAA